MRTQLIFRDAQGIEGTVELRLDPIFVGRAVECAIRTDDGMVSRRHARIFRDGSRWWIEDLGSANGVFAADQRVSRHCMVHGEAIRCGSLWLRFVDETGASAAPVSSVAAPVAHGGPGLQLNVQPVAQGVPASFQQGAPSYQQAPQQQRPAPFAAAPAPAFIPAMGQTAPQQGNFAQPANLAGGSGTSSKELLDLRAELEKVRGEKASLEAEVKTLKEGSRETLKLTRRVEQLQSDVRRLRGGKDDGPTPFDKLQEEFSALEKERDELLVRIKELGIAVEKANELPASKRAEITRTRAAEANTELNDVLSEVRISLRTIGDEIEPLLASFPAESREIVETEMRKAKEQMETARVLLRDIRTAVEG